MSGHVMEYGVFLKINGYEYVTWTGIDLSTAEIVAARDEDAIIKKRIVVYSEWAECES